MKKYEQRQDCDEFEVKKFEQQCGDCQTDGHYLCVGCKHIAPFEQMELSDNRMRYYEKQEKMNIENEKLMDSYMKGFDDELEGKVEQTKFNSDLELKAYNIGRLDAWAGDDVASVNYQSKEQIIAHIRS